jgi:hypothetical protein
MQFAKDSFYMALRERLVALNPQRTVTVNGATRPALIVAENEAVVPVEPLPDAFYIEWGAAKIGLRQTNDNPLVEMECIISHHTFGTVESGVDRGRSLAKLDSELLSICQPQRTTKRDFTRAPSVDLGTEIFWTIPELGEVSGIIAHENTSQRVRLERKSQLKLFFFPEVAFQ